MRARTLPLCTVLLVAACGTEPVRVQGPGVAGTHDTVHPGAVITPAGDTARHPAPVAGLPTIATDGFAITPRTLAEARYDPDAPYSFDGRWFGRTTDDAVLAIEEYTDHHHLKVFLFRKGKAPNALAGELPFFNAVGNKVPMDSLKRSWTTLFRALNTITPERFTSRKGFTFGTPEGEVLNAFGAPDSIWKDGPYTVRDWHFVGDGAYDGRVDLHGRPLAEGSFGHDVRLWTRNGRLSAYRLHNAIP